MILQMIGGLLIVGAASYWISLTAQHEDRLLRLERKAGISTTLAQPWAKEPTK